MRKRAIFYLLSDDAYNKFEKLYHYYRQNGASAYATFYIILFKIIISILFRLESPCWQWVRANHFYFFPHISRECPRSGDIFRYILRSIWLIFFYPEPKTRTIENIKNFFNKGLNFGYSKIERFLKKYELNIASQQIVQNFEKRNYITSRLLFIILSFFAVILLLISITQPFKPPAQFIFVIVLWGMAMSIRHIPGHVSTIFLIALSIIASCRYLWWRYTYTLIWDDAQSELFGNLLILAETYVWLVMVLGYFQTIWPLHRDPVALPENSSTWPTVDIMITTYNEDLSIIKPGIYSALGLDWPKEKLNIYILDDGNRPQFKEFADMVGVNYIARPTHEHAKAGNINYALHHSKGELVAIFDCDYVITNPFLKLTVGWFLKDPQLAILQTPHHFFSPDPFERNLKFFRKVPNESALFYGVVQDGNDTWNATFFCGSAGIMRRSALEKIGGLSVESVTEDAYTSLRLQRQGYNSAYIRIPLAAGLATESLSGLLIQRKRWARGMAQIFRMDNPLFGKGLKLGQRICYFNSMLHFFSGVPRLIFYITPASFLILNAYVVYAPGIMILLYAIPHLVHAVLTNDRIQGRYRHFLWNEIYETVMAWYIAIPTIQALINPYKYSRFNVTPKGEEITKEYVDWRSARPYLFVLCINIAGLFAACYRLAVDPAHTIIAVLITTFWTFYNIVILGGALGVSIETIQKRRSPRVNIMMPAEIRISDGNVYSCTLKDYSDRGVGIQIENTDLLKAEKSITLLLKKRHSEFAFPGKIMYIMNDNVGISLHELSLEQNIEFIQCTFARAEIWSQWQEEIREEKPLQSISNVFVFDLRSYFNIIKYTPPVIRHVLLGIAEVVIFIGSLIPYKRRLK